MSTRASHPAPSARPDPDSRAARSSDPAPCGPADQAPNGTERDASSGEADCRRRLERAERAYAQTLQDLEQALAPADVDDAHAAALGGESPIGREGAFAVASISARLARRLGVDRAESERAPGPEDPRPEPLDEHRRRIDAARTEYHVARWIHFGTLGHTDAAAGLDAVRERSARSHAATLGEQVDRALESTRTAARDHARRVLDTTGYVDGPMRVSEIASLVIALDALDIVGESRCGEGQTLLARLRRAVELGHAQPRWIVKRSEQRPRLRLDSARPS